MIPNDGTGKIGARTLISPAERKRSFLSMGALGQQKIMDGIAEAKPSPRIGGVEK